MLLDASMAGSPAVATGVASGRDGLHHEEDGSLLPNDDGSTMNGLNRRLLMISSGRA